MYLSNKLASAQAVLSRPGSIIHFSALSLLFLQSSALVWWRRDLLLFVSSSTPPAQAGGWEQPVLFIVGAFGTPRRLPEGSHGNYIAFTRYFFSVL